MWAYSKPVLRLVLAPKALTATGRSLAFLKEACEQAVKVCGMWGGLPAGWVQESTEAEHLAELLVTCPSWGTWTWGQRPKIEVRGKVLFHGVRNIGSGTGGLLGKLKTGREGLKG